MKAWCIDLSKWLKASQTYPVDTSKIWWTTAAVKTAHLNIKPLKTSLRSRPNKCILCLWIAKWWSARISSNSTRSNKCSSRWINLKKSSSSSNSSKPRYTCKIWMSINRILKIAWATIILAGKMNKKLSLHSVSKVKLRLPRLKTKMCPMFWGPIKLNLTN